jgi:hypothetical protein
MNISNTNKICMHSRRRKLKREFKIIGDNYEEMKSQKIIFFEFYKTIRPIKFNQSNERKKKKKNFGGVRF